MVADIPYLVAVLAGCALFAQFEIGRQRVRTGWQTGKGLVAPLVVIGVVPGSIYGGTTGIAEAAA